MARKGKSKWEDHLARALLTRPAEVWQEAVEVLEKHGCHVKKLKSGLYYTSTLGQFVFQLSTALYQLDSGTCMHQLHGLPLLFIAGVSNCMHTQYSTEMKMSAHEAKLRSPFMHVLKISPALNDDAVNWNLRRHVCARFWTFIGLIWECLSARLEENSSKEALGLTKDFEDGSKCVQ